MTILTNVSGATQFALQSAISAYADEAYTNAKKLNGTGITSPNSMIDVNTETYIGQVRWMKPLNPVVNVASLTNATAGTGSTFASDFLTYIKTVRTHGMTQVNLQSVVSQADGLAKIGRDFSETRAQDEHNAILAVLRGVAYSEILNGAATGSGATGLGGQTFSNDPTDAKYGMYVDLGAAKPVIAASASVQGAARAEGFLQAIGMGFKDYEPEYMYLVTSPEVFASLRSANLVDQDTVTEGNITFNTIFSGKFRIIQTRANQGFSATELGYINAANAGVDVAGTKLSFLVKPGAIAMESLSVPEPVGITKIAGAYMGGGTTDVWYRWGYVAHPAGYNWNGATGAFPSDAEYVAAPVANVGVGSRGAWTRKATSALSLGILPILHG
jgi:hypothetical protein